ncbi:MAG: preprotein translocase subunit SecA [Porphyromonas sp.]|uniref:preprotein translocase subunit SecA n=1 Tax=Porphyromonas sp. TaxID=1924944 RepID=UPI002A90D7E7|nr:preprotein translocase subunit SecA [Porphyromonas sp.]MDD7468683.1 preprotein translocase subunit SecA [Bacteroidales bacterium]MDY6101474.1 preprotein translocase subunit SecA [Porphyromonas sp.]
MSFFKDLLAGIFGNKSQNDLKQIYPIVDQIKSTYETIDQLSHDELRAHTARMRQDLRDHVAEEQSQIAELKAKVDSAELSEREALWEQIDVLEEKVKDKLEDKLNEILPEAFAVMKSTARRFAENSEIVVTATQYDRDLSVEHDFVTIDGDKAIYKNEWEAGGNLTKWDMVHYDVQLIGGIVLHQGKIAEMATGEGKTLVATLPVFLNALSGNGVHVVTVNDYLSKRDEEWMGPLYQFHGLTVDCIDKHEPNSPERKRAYDCDITFGTNNEFGFDYLRDNMARRPEDMVQRVHNYAIVDEVDSVLIDDARTPLIISGPVESKGDQMFEEFREDVESVVNAQRTLCTRLLNEAKKKIASDDPKEVDEGYLLLFRSYKGLPKYKPLIKFLSTEGVKKRLLDTEGFYMQDNNREMHVVTDPLYFVVDEKNNQIELTDKGFDLLSQKNEDPAFFVLPDIAAQMSELENKEMSEEEKAGTKDELLTNYSVKSERVHTVQQLLKAYTLFDRDDQYVVIDNQVMIVDEQTGRIMNGRRYSDGLHQAIEAKEHVKVQQASQTKATITLQNYFRMYHKLSGMTGTAETEAKEFWDIYKLDVVVIPTNRPVIRKDENDRIYKTAKAKYNAVIDEIQAITEAGRPVLVGTTSVEISELLSRMLDLRHIPHNVLNAKLFQKEADIVAQAGQSSTVTIATNMAGRGTDIKLSPEVKAAGGLAIIGTERHESRRVDRQLRGRAGRQGDPGSSVFFVSLEDKLMRLFGSDRMAKVLSTMGLKDDDMLVSKQLSNTVENAQKKVEENNYGIRKHLLEYDDVKNAQRKVIYTRRRHALMGERIGLDVMNTLEQSAIYLATKHAGGSFDDFRTEVYKVFAIECPVSETEFKGLEANDIAARLMDEASATLKRRMDRMAEQADPALQAFYQEHGSQVEQIYVPVTDGRLMYNVVTNLKEAVESNSQSISKSFMKTILLYTIDEAWERHLLAMDELQNAVRTASYENKDPLVIFKVEAYDLFKRMIDDLNVKITEIIMRGHINIATPEEQEARRQAQAARAAAMARAAAAQQQVRIGEHHDDPRANDRSRYREQKDDYQQQAEQRTEAGRAASEAAQANNTPYRAAKKVGRNDPCPCGSGKKFKNCHGRNL